jgi:hypothetical protein
MMPAAEEPQTVSHLLESMDIDTLWGDVENPDMQRVHEQQEEEIAFKMKREATPVSVRDAPGELLSNNKNILYF